MPWNTELPEAEWYTDDDPDLPLLVEAIQEDVPLLAIDTETTGLDITSDVPLFWSISWGERRICMPAATLHRFAPVLLNPKKKWVLANAKYDQHILANVGLSLAGDLIDCQVMHALLYEEQPHALKLMAEAVLGWRWSDFDDTFRLNKAGKLNAHSPVNMVKKGGSFPTVQDALMWCYHNDLPLLVEYAANDAYGTWKCYEALKKELEGTNIHSLYPNEYRTLADYFFKLEVPFTRVLWTCERNGAYIDKSYLHTIARAVTEEMNKLERAITKEAGRPININSPKELQDFFFKELKLTPVKMTKGGKTGKRSPSVDAEVLEELSYEHSIAHLMVTLKELDKLLGTYANGLQKHIKSDGRIHARLNQDVARCMPAGELVLTNRGYIPVENVLVGDLVITHTGSTKPITELFLNTTPEPIYRVELDNGLVLRTNGRHPYRANGGWCPADELQVNDAIMIHSGPETWRTVVDWNDFEVSSWGRVYNKKTRRFLTQTQKNKWGHLKVCLYKNGAQQRGEDRKDLAVHQLVLRAFARWVDGKETRHLNGIAWDNTLQNLQCGTSAENRQDALRHGTMSQLRAGRTHLTEEHVNRIRSLGSPGQPPSSTSKLTYEKATEIRVKYARGYGRAELAREYKVTYQSVDNIIKNRTWIDNPVRGPTAEQLASEYGVSAGTIRNIWAGRRWQNEDYVEGKSATFSTSHVVSITVEPSEPTYGLTVADDHSHVTGGIVTHNTGRLSSREPNLF